MAEKVQGKQPRMHSHPAKSSLSCRVRVLSVSFCGKVLGGREVIGDGSRCIGGRRRRGAGPDAARVTGHEHRLGSLVLEIIQGDPDDSLRT